MKWAVLILGGAADEPLPELDGASPLEAASTPNLDRLASIGRVGLVATTPPGAWADPAMGAMALLGCDVELHWPGRGAIEALAAGLTPAEDLPVFRVDLVRVREGVGDPDAGVVLEAAPAGLTRAETRELFAAVLHGWRSGVGESAAGLKLSTVSPGVGTLTDEGDLLDAEVIARPPAAVLGRDWRKTLPAGRKAEALARLMEHSAAALAEHEVNLGRQAAGLAPANLVWIWGAGRSAPIPSLDEALGVRASAVGSTSGFRGVCRALGVPRPPITTGRSEESLDALAQGAAAGLERADLLVVHADHADRAARAGDLPAKIDAIEAADRLLVGPLMRALEDAGGADLKPADARERGWRLLVCCDAAASTKTRAWLDHPTPFVMGGAWTPAVVRRRFVERDARESDLFVDRGCDLLEYFLFSGLKGVEAFRKNRTAKR